MFSDTRALVLGPLAPPVTQEFPLSLGGGGGGRVSRRATEEKERVPLLTAQDLRGNPSNQPVGMKVRWGDWMGWTGAKVLVTG